MMRSVRRGLCLGIIFFGLCGFTGCEKMEHGPALNLPFEVSEVWIEEVHAKTDSTMTNMQDVKADVEQMVIEIESAVADAEKLMEEIKQDTAKESRQEENIVEIKDMTISGNMVSGNNIAEAIVSGSTISRNMVSGNNVSESILTGVSVSGNNISRQPQREPAPAGQGNAVRVYEFTQSGKEYFSDALFIGDSRTTGLQLYGTLDNADYFAEPGLNLYTLSRTKLKVDGKEKIGLSKLLEKKVYGKIYLMLGINELGYHFDTTLEKYQALVTELRTKQPGAILYVCANLHVTDVRDKHDKTHNNTNINKINEKIEEFADNQNIFYLDANVLFDDEEGNLDKEIASDDSHIKIEYYDEWCGWLEENTIVK